jgi:hypothetical protein
VVVAVPLGLDAYKRLSVGTPEVRLENRYVERDPANLREKSALPTRPGATSLDTFAGGIGRGTYSKPGLFNGDLFVVSGSNLWRYDSDGTQTQITGTIANSGNPYVTWMKGIGYEYLFIADGTNFQYFSEHAAGTLTLSGGVITSQVIKIGTIYYSWSATVDPGTTPDGTSAKPYLAKLGTGLTADEDSLANMVALLNFSGSSGLDYSSSVPGASATVTATSTETTLVVTAIDNTSAGNSIATTVFSGSFLAWTGSTLAGGGGTTLRPVTGYDASEVIKSLTSLAGSVLASVGNTRKFYWINPGEVTIDPLNFASKESQPDNILDMLTVGDQALIMGDGSAENWYATGDFDLPFAPVKGRVYQRGVIEGTPVVVDDGVILVGNNGIVYMIGYQVGGEAVWGVHRISTNTLEERIRRQLRYEQGLTP